MAYEALHMIHGRKKGKTRNLALKLDVSKAYDRVEWVLMKSGGVLSCNVPQLYHTL